MFKSQFAACAVVVVAGGIGLSQPPTTGEDRAARLLMYSNPVVDGQAGSFAKWALAAEKSQGRGKPTKTVRSSLDGKVFSDVVQVGEMPEGFGKYVWWNRADKEVFFVIYINPSDAHGVMIGGLKKGDTLEVTSASGICSFKKNDGTLVSSIIGIAATGAGLLVPPATPLIKAGEQFAINKFGKPGNGMTRDAFGQDPADGLYEDHEGGLVVSLPEADGPCYAHKGLKRDGVPRTDNIRPDHVKHGFFLVRHNRAHNTRAITADGEAYIVAWDKQFDDNSGYYRAVVKVTRQ